MTDSDIPVTHTLQYFCEIYGISCKMFSDDQKVFLTLGTLPSFFEDDYKTAYISIVENYYPQAQLIHWSTTDATFCLGTVFDLLNPTPKKHLMMSSLMSLTWLSRHHSNKL